MTGHTALITHKRGMISVACSCGNAIRHGDEDPQEAFEAHKLEASKLDLQAHFSAQRGR